MNSHGVLQHVIILFLLVVLSFLDLGSCQSDNPRNIETFYPLPSPVQTPPPADPVPEIGMVPPPPIRSRTWKAIVTAVFATAACTFVVAGAFFFLLTRYSERRKRKRNRIDGGESESDGRTRMPAGSRSESKSFDGSVVDENGLMSNSGSLMEEPLNTAKRRRSSSSHSQIFPDQDAEDRCSSNGGGGGHSQPEQPAVSSMAVPEAPAPLPASIPSPPPLQQAPPLPASIPPPPPAQQAPAPPPPPAPAKKPAVAPPPPSSRAPVAPPNPPRRGGKADGAPEGSGSGHDHVKLKPLHWEKVNINRERPNVWDKLERGSFQYNGDMMEALFGVTANDHHKSSIEDHSSGHAGESSNHSAKIFILDPRKSQNTAIVLRTLGITREELINALLEGKGLSAEILEKLTKLGITAEEVSAILAFDGDPASLADAESFLHELLKAVPSAFTRADEMLFRSSYDSEIQNIKRSLLTLESACNELKQRGIFLKLLEAVLKAGNRLNAGTSRGNAKAFNLTTLRKLSDYKGSDGKTTLLHFVVHEVVRSEGKRCFMARNSSMSRQNSNLSPPLEDPSAKEDREKEYLLLGLPVVGGLSSELSNVRRAANVDYDSLRGTLSSLSNCIRDAKTLVADGSSVGGGGGFCHEMGDFLAAAEVEVKVVQVEHIRVLNMVKETTHYYQAKASNDKNPIQVFSIVRDFLGMVDLACIEIARDSQLKKKAKQMRLDSRSGSSHPDDHKTGVTFSSLPENFLSDKSSSGSEGES